MPIKYLKGDATHPLDEGPKLIAHIVNDTPGGAWGRGFVLAISKRWKLPERAYRQWASGEWPLSPPFEWTCSGFFSLGHVQYVEVERGLIVANMVAQHRYGRSDPPPIRYEALSTCLGDVARVAREHHASVHAPRIGCGLAGGKWEAVEPIIQRTLQGIQVYVYDP